MSAKPKNAAELTVSSAKIAAKITPKTDSSVIKTVAVEDGVYFMPQACKNQHIPVDTTPR